MTRSILLPVLRGDRVIADLSLRELDLLIRESRVARLLPAIAALATKQGVTTTLPRNAADALTAATHVAAANRRALTWELRKLGEAFSACAFPVLLLKGAAYHALDLPFSQSRLIGDIDLLVPAAAIREAESRLLLHGWLPTHLNAYDQRYYREWMHEIPPLKHLSRHSLVDLHHTIAPPVGRIKVDAERLLANRVPLAAHPPFATLAPADLILHSATHLLLDSEYDHALRDLVDIRALLSHYGDSSALLEALADRAQELGLQTPLYYTLAALQSLLGVSIPEQLTNQMRDLPSPVTRGAMRWLIRNTFVPNHKNTSGPFLPITRRLLYVRSHYLKMPFRLLVPHLLYKAFRSDGTQESAAP